jgi:predicted nucleic acid-binding protein
MKKYLVDTCGWIEWLEGSKLASAFEPFLKHTTQLIVPTLIQYELYKWVCREKNVTTALEVIGITEGAIVVPLDTHIALRAADIAKQYKLAMTDAIVYASAQKKEVELVTADKHFLGLPKVHYIAKA